MLLRQAHATASRRYGDKLAVVAYMKGTLALLREPAASLWERMETAISLSDAVSFLSERFQLNVTEEIVEKAISAQSSVGIIVNGKDEHEINELDSTTMRGRGFCTDDMFAEHVKLINHNVGGGWLLKAEIEVTNACNIRCGHCYINDYRNRQLMNVDEIDDMLQQLADSGVLFVNLTGGEAVLRNEFAHIVNLARKQRFVISLLSNGTLIDDQIAEQLKVVYLANAFISLYGVKPETHEEITRKSGSFDATIKTVCRLREIGIPVVLRYLIMGHNVKEVELLSNFADSLDCMFSTSYNIFDIYKNGRGVRKFEVSRDQLTWLFRNRMVNPPRRAQCIAGINRIHVSCIGDIFPCDILRVSLGNIRENRIKNIMESPGTGRQVAAMQSIPVKCSTCGKVAFCPRCPGLAFHEDGDVSGVSTKACYITDVFKEMTALEAASQPGTKASMI